MKGPAIPVRRSRHREEAERPPRDVFAAAQKTNGRRAAFARPRRARTAAAPRLRDRAEHERPPRRVCATAQKTNDRRAAFARPRRARTTAARRLRDRAEGERPPRGVCATAQKANGGLAEFTLTWIPQTRRAGYYAGAVCYGPGDGEPVHRAALRASGRERTRRSGGQTANQDEINRSEPMDTVNLGKTGLKVSRICLGCMTYGSPDWRPWILRDPRLPRGALRAPPDPRPAATGPGPVATPQARNCNAT